MTERLLKSEAERRRKISETLKRRNAKNRVQASSEVDLDDPDSYLGKPQSWSDAVKRAQWKRAHLEVEQQAGRLIDADDLKDAIAMAKEILLERIDSVEQLVMDLMDLSQMDRVEKIQQWKRETREIIAKGLKR